MEKELKHPDSVDTQGSSDEATFSSSEENTRAASSRAGDAERARFAKRKRIRAYQKIDYWQ